MGIRFLLLRNLRWNLRVLFSLFWRLERVESMFFWGRSQWGLVTGPSRVSLGVVWMWYEFMG